MIMKLNKLFMPLLAALALTACSNDDEATLQTAQQQKSVTISLANVVSATRSVGTPITTNSAVNLGGFQVFFSDGTNLYEAKDKDGSAATTYFESLQSFKDNDNDNNSTKTFHFLDAKVNEVIVVGNITSQLSNKTMVSDLEEILKIENQQNPQNLKLYGSADLKLKTQDPTMDEHAPLYEANVVLSPRVSRIEIAGFEYKQKEGASSREYTSLEISQVLLNNYYTQANLTDGAVITTGENTKGLFLPVDAGTVYAEMLKASGWMTDKFVNTATTEEDEDSEQPTLPLVTLNESSSWKKEYSSEGDDINRPVYHFFPNASNIATAYDAEKQTGDHPQLIIKLTGKKSDGNDATIEVPLYLATSTFTPAVTKDFAKIYVMSFEFNDGNLQNPQKCVEVKVSVVNWIVITSVTPNFPSPTTGN